MLADLPVAPAQVLVELAPVLERALHDQTRRRAEFVARILDHVSQHSAQDLGTLAEHQAELRQHSADLVDAGGALFLQPFAHTVQAHHALLFAGLDVAFILHLSQPDVDAQAESSCRQ